VIDGRRDTADNRGYLGQLHPIKHLSDLSARVLITSLLAGSSAKGRTDVPKIVDWYMDGKIRIDPMIIRSVLVY